MSDERQERVAPPPPGFPDGVPVFHEDRLAGIEWVRLYKVAFPNQFYPSLKSRLTPKSGLFPCVYIASNVETAVAEVWGDRLRLAKERGRSIYVINAEKAEEQAFLKAKSLPALRLCDLTDSNTRIRLGVDSGALFAPDLSIPQAWAEMIATHPNKYDGIVYRSRHTDAICAVLWKRPGIRELDTEITFEAAGAFRESSAAYAVALLIGIKLSWPSGTVVGA